MSDGTLKFDTKIDGSGFDSGMNKLESTASRVGDFIKGKLGADVIEKAAGKLVEFGKKAINLASDLDEVQNVVDVTFGEQAAAIESFSKTASAQFGLTELQVKQYSGTLGAMVKSMGLTEKEASEMSLDMVGLTGDMASFYNLDHDTAFEKIRSGLSGETEPLKQLGINMSQANLEAFALSEGIKKAYKDMSEAEKVSLRYNYIMTQTADAHGDFARTSDGYANQVRMLQNNIDSLAANIGKALLPAVNWGVGALNSLFTVGEDQNDPLIGEIKEAADALTGENGLAAQIDTIKNNYAETQIEIRVKYNQAKDALEEYGELLEEYQEGGKYSGINLKVGSSGDEVAKLQSDLISLGYAIDETEVSSRTFGDTTLAAVKQFQTSSDLAVDGIAGVKTQAALVQQTSSALTDTVARLVELYPELQQYVGSDGLFTIEQDEVQALIDKYNELARSKAYAAMLSDYEAAYYTTEGKYEMLTAKRDVAQAALDEKMYGPYGNRGYVGRYSTYMRGLEIQSATQTGANLINGELDVEDFQKLSQYVNDYIDAFEGLNGVDLNALSELEGFSFADLFDSEWNFNAEATLENYQAVADLVSALQDAAASSLDEDKTDLETYIETLNTANEALDTAYSEMQTAQEDYSAMATAYNSIFAGIGESVPTEIGNGVLNNTASAIADIDAFFDSLMAEIAIRAAEVNTAASNAGKSVYAGGAPSHGGTGPLNPPKHATGLNYVPYDNYVARLHYGEAVLSASEAERWRTGQSGGIDYGALAQAVSGAVRASGGANNRPIVLSINGRELARVTAKDNDTAIGAYNRRVNMGVGR